MFQNLKPKPNSAGKIKTRIENFSVLVTILIPQTLIFKTLHLFRYKIRTNLNFEITRQALTRSFTISIEVKILLILTMAFLASFFGNSAMCRQHKPELLRLYPELKSTNHKSYITLRRRSVRYLIDV